VQKDQFEIKYIFLHLFFLQNFYPEIRAVYNAAYWSLPVEVGFYAVVLAAVYLRWVNFKTVLMAAVLYSVIVKLLFFNGQLSADAVWIIACTTPLWVKDKIKHEKLVLMIFLLSVLVWVSLCVKWVALGGEHMLLLHPLLHTTYKLLVPLSFAGLLLFLLKKESYFRGAFKKWAYALGAISYSVYLMHHVPPRVLSVLGFQVYNLTGLVISGLLTVFISFYLNRWIENRWIQVGRKIVN
jgi:peptidoglycan/LPS O-acetylase OafA/YrhL